MANDSRSNASPRRNESAEQSAERSGGRSAASDDRSAAGDDRSAAASDDRSAAGDDRSAAASDDRSAVGGDDRSRADSVASAAESRSRDGSNSNRSRDPSPRKERKDEKPLIKKSPRKSPRKSSPRCVYFFVFQIDRLIKSFFFLLHHLHSSLRLFPPTMRFRIFLYFPFYFLTHFSFFLMLGLQARCGFLPAAPTLSLRRAVHQEKPSALFGDEPPSRRGSLRGRAKTLLQIRRKGISLNTMLFGVGMFLFV